MYKNNSRNSSKFKGCSPLQLHRKLKDLSSAVSYYSYTERCAPRDRVNQRLQEFFLTQRPYPVKEKDTKKHKKSQCKTLTFN